MRAHLADAARRTCSTTRESFASAAGMIVAPLRTLRAIAAADDTPATPPFALILGVTAALQAKTLARLLWLADDNASIMLKRTFEALTRGLRTDVVVLLTGACGLALIAGWRTRRGGQEITPWGALRAACWLLVPLAVLKATGGLVAALLAPDASFAWALPQHAVDGPAVYPRGRLDGGRLALKAVITYGWPAALALAFSVQLLRKKPKDSVLRPRRTAVGVAFVAGLVGAFVVVSGVDVVKNAARIRPLQPGDVLPDATFRVLRADGVDAEPEKVRLSSFRGQVMVLDFWASWCGPCRRSMPELSALHDALSARGLVVLGLNRDASKADAKRALASLQPHFPSVRDDRGYGERLGLTTLPTSYVVGRDGVVRHLHIGIADIDVLRREVLELLAED